MITQVTHYFNFYAINISFNSHLKNIMLWENELIFSFIDADSLMDFRLNVMIHIILFVFKYDRE